MTRNTYTSARAVFLAALMVVSVAGGSIAFAGTAAADTHTVANGDSISEALNAAESGDTITVESGTYDPFTVSTADVTIQSAPGAMPTIQGDGSKTAVKISADGVTLAGFEITGDDATKDGVAITGDRAGVTVENNEISGMAMASAPSDGGIDGASYAIHNWGGALDGVTVTGNTIEDIGTTGYVDASEDGEGAEPRAISLGPFEGADTVIQGNTITNVVDDGEDSYGILLYDGDSEETANVQITDNALGNAIHDVYSWGDGAPSINGEDAGPAQIDSLYASNTEVDQITADGSSSSTITVGTDGDESTIADALSAATENDRVVVQDGTYSPFTVSTAGVDVVAADGVTPEIDGSGASPVVTISADDVVLDGFEITGDADTKDGVAITGDRAGVTVSNNDISGMANAAAEGGIDGVTYAIHNWGGPLSDVTVTGNTIEDIGTTDYDGGDGDGAKPQVIALGPFEDDDTVVTDNTISGVKDDGEASYGVILYDSDADDGLANVDVSGNDLGNAIYDVYSWGGAEIPLNGIESSAEDKIDSLFEQNTNVDQVSVDGTTQQQTAVTVDPTEANSPSNYDVTFVSNHEAYSATQMTLDLSALGTDVSGVTASDLALTIGGDEVGINSISPGSNTVQIDFESTTLNQGDVIQLSSSNHAFQNPSEAGTETVDVSVSSVDTTIETGTGTVEITEDTVPSVSDASVETEPISQSDAGTEQTVTVEFSELMDTSSSPTVEITGLDNTDDLTVEGDSTDWTDATTWEGTVTIPDNDDDVDATIVVSGAEDDEGNALTGDTTTDLTVDTNAPAVAAEVPSEPISGDYDLTQIFEVTASAEDSELTYEYSTDGGDSWESVGDATLDTTTLADGDVVLRATAKDDVGNSDTAQTTVSVDNPPSALQLKVTATDDDSQVEVTVQSDEALDEIDVDVVAQKALPSEAETGGAPSATLSREDFTTTEADDGYTDAYTTTWTAPRDGSFDFTLDSVTDTGDNQITETDLDATGGGDAQTDWTFDASAPTVDNAFIESADGTETTIEVRFSEPVSIDDEIPTEAVSIEGVDSITGVTANDDSLTVTVGDTVETGDEPTITVDGSVYDEETKQGGEPDSGPMTDEDGASTVVHTTHLTLSEGQNFVSVPAETGTVSISDLDTENVNSIWTYDEGQWSKHLPDGPQDFTTMQGGQGYIITMESGAAIDVNVQNTLSTSGDSPTLPGQVQLEEGWNLVGHWQEGAQSPHIALGTISDAVFQVYGQSESGFETVVGAGQSLDTGSDLQHGEAYWVFVTEDTVYGPADWQQPIAE